MVQGLISLKFAMLRNSSAGMRHVGWFLGALFVVATWAAAVVSSDASVRHSVLTLIFAGWLLGAMIGPVMLSGSGVLRADYFALLPLSRATLGRGLLATVFVGVAATFVLLALLAAVWHAAPFGIAAVGVAVAGVLLTWVFVITTSRLVYGLLGSAMRSRLGIEIAGVQWGLFLAAMFAGWMVVSVAFESVPRLLANGLPAGPITVVLDVFPTSWTMLAVEAIGAGDVGQAGVWMLALLALDALVVLATIPLLVPRAQQSTRRRERPRSARLVAGRGFLPATPTGAVIMKELRQWRRDPWRALESSTGVWTGIATGAFALLGGYTSPVAAFAGVVVTIMVAFVGCNLYGQDGSAVWQNVVGESDDSVRADVRGRQWALVLVFLPRALVVSAVFVPLAGAWWSVPFVLAALAATVGAASGAALITSAVGVSPGEDPRRRVGPNDANGNIALHGTVALTATAVGLVPTLGVIIWAAITPSLWLLILMPIVRVLNGVMAAWLLGKVAINYLSSRMVDVFSRIRYARVFRDGTPKLLDGIADAMLKGEVQAAEEQQTERDKKLAKAEKDEPLPTAELHVIPEPASSYLVMLPIGERRRRELFDRPRCWSSQGDASVDPSPADNWSSS